MSNNNDDKINVSGILANKAMIANLSASCWSASKSDKEATKELLAQKKAEKKAGSVTKKLVNKDHPTLKRIREVINAIKSYHNTKTLPWDNDGGRLLPSTMHAEYSAFFRKSRVELEEAVDAFVAVYPNMIAEASFMLGDLYNSEDYPHPSEMKSKFAINVDFSPVPSGADFRVDIPKHEQDKICQEIEDRVKNQYADSMKRIWGKVHKNVSHMFERLSDEEKIFKNSMVNNLSDLIDILPKLNIMQDANLDSMAMELKRELCANTPESLRKDPDLRKETADKAKAFLDKISIFSGLGVIEEGSEQPDTEVIEQNDDTNDLDDTEISDVKLSTYATGEVDVDANPTDIEPAGNENEEINISELAKKSIENIDRFDEEEDSSQVA